MKLLVLDNYDSFTYNLVHMVEHILEDDVDVYKNDEISLEEAAKYDHIILSPGPGIPSEAGILISLIKKYAHEKSILGVCLGHQAIAEAFGSSLINLDTVYHGVATKCRHNKRGIIFKDIPEEFIAGRYHSWITSDDLPEQFEVLARDEQNYIMAFQHRKYDLTGVQFHPESVLTPDGEKMIRNWLQQPRDFV